jgi:hypothetical protein
MPAHVFEDGVLLLHRVDVCPVGVSQAGQQPTQLAPRLLIGPLQAQLLLRVCVLGGREGRGSRSVNQWILTQELQSRNAHEMPSRCSSCMGTTTAGWAAARDAADAPPPRWTPPGPAPANTVNECVSVLIMVMWGWGGGGGKKWRQQESQPVSECVGCGCGCGVEGFAGGGGSGIAQSMPSKPSSC